MGTQVRANYSHHQSNIMAAAATTLTSSPPTCLNPVSQLLFKGNSFSVNKKISLVRSLGFERAARLRRNKYGIVVSSSGNAAAPLWDSWKPEKTSSAPSFSDILWPSAG